MKRYPYLVGDKASNKPDASTAYNIAATALDGARTFAAALSAGDIASGDELAVRAYKYDANGNPTGAWEICWCTFTDASPDTLTRGTLIESSTGSKIDWSTATGEDFAPALEVVDIATGDAVRWSGTFDNSAAMYTFGGASDQFQDGYDYIICLVNCVLADHKYLRGEVYKDGAWEQTNYHLRASMAYEGGTADQNVSTTYIALNSNNVAAGGDQTAGAEETIEMEWEIISPGEDAKPHGRVHAWFNYTNGQGASLNGVWQQRNPGVVRGARLYTNDSTNIVSGSYFVIERRRVI